MKANTDILINASKDIKKGIMSLDKAIEIIKNSKGKKQSKLENNLSDLKNQMSSIRKSVKAESKIK